MHDEIVNLFCYNVVFFTGTVKFAINIFDGTGEFEICESGSVAVKGQIRKPENIDKEVLDLSPPEVPKTGLPLTSPDIYKELGLRGYDYSGIFRGIASSDNHGTFLFRIIFVHRKGLEYMRCIYTGIVGTNIAFVIILQELAEN